MPQYEYKFDIIFFAHIVALFRDIQSRDSENVFLSTFALCRGIYLALCLGPRIDPFQNTRAILSRRIAEYVGEGGDIK